MCDLRFQGSGNPPIQVYDNGLYIDATLYNFDTHAGCSQANVTVGWTDNPLVGLQVWDLFFVPALSPPQRIGPAGAIPSSASFWFYPGPSVGPFLSIVALGSCFDVNCRVSANVQNGINPYDPLTAILSFAFAFQELRIGGGQPGGGSGHARHPPAFFAFGTQNVGGGQGETRVSARALDPESDDDRAALQRLEAMPWARARLGGPVRFARAKEVHVAAGLEKVIVPYGAGEPQARVTVPPVPMRSRLKYTGAMPLDLASALTGGKWQRDGLNLHLAPGEVRQTVLQLVAEDGAEKAAHAVAVEQTVDGRLVGALTVLFPPAEA